jgi:hypothetical protein
MEDEMNGTHLDGIARALARDTNRRVVARGLAAAVGLGAMALGPGGAAARNPRSRCEGYCRDLDHSGRDFGKCVAACVRAGGPPPEETCVELEDLCTPPVGDEPNPCCNPPGCEELGPCNVCYLVEYDENDNPVHRCIAPR